MQFRHFEYGNNKAIHASYLVRIRFGIENAGVNKKECIIIQFIA